MLSVRTFKYYRSLNKNVITQTIVKQSTANKIKTVDDSDQNSERQVKTFETIINVTKRVRKKKPNRPPFAKNLFLGKFDNDFLTFPQLEKEDMDALETDTSQLQKVLQQSHMMKAKSISDKNFRQNLADYKAIALQGPQLMNARGCNSTESFKFIETLCEHKFAQSLVTHEYLGVNVLDKFADDVLKKKYLPSLISGESLIALCLNESDYADVSTFKTEAKLTQDEKQWVLNGEKSLVFNGSYANYFVVFAITDVKYVKDLKEVKLSAFLVDRDSSGITVKERDTSGINIADVTFMNTIVPVENVIGKINTGEQMLYPIVIESRLAFGPMCIVLAKKVLNNLVKEILNRSDEHNRLHKTDAMRMKIAQIATKIYAMESMVYLTTGLIDSYENQDVEIESAIVKVFCAEQLREISLECLDIIGAAAANDSHWANGMYKEAIRYLTLHESNEMMKIVLVLLGLQHAGVAMKGEVEKLRNPFFHTNFLIKKMFTARKDSKDDPNLNLYLQEHLHPSLTQAALNLDYCVQRLRFGTETVLVNYGSEVMNHHIDLERLANCVIEVYALTAILGRASRSYCIGLQHADLEMIIANTYCNDSVLRVKQNINKILNEHLRNDISYKMIAKRIFKFKEYCLEHPLKRNF